MATLANLRPIRECSDIHLSLPHLVTLTLPLAAMSLPTTCQPTCSTHGSDLSRCTDTCTEVPSLADVPHNASDQNTRPLLQGIQIMEGSLVAPDANFNEAMHSYTVSGPNGQTVTVTYGFDLLKDLNGDQDITVEWAAICKTKPDSADEEVTIFSEEQFQNFYLAELGRNLGDSMHLVRELITSVWKKLPADDTPTGLPSWVTGVHRQAIARKLEQAQAWEPRAQRLIDSLAQPQGHLEDSM